MPLASHIQIQDRAMADPHRLGQTGGARGVDHISQTLSPGGLEHRRTIHRQHRQSRHSSRQRSRQSQIRQTTRLQAGADRIAKPIERIDQQHRLGIVEQELQTLDGISHIQRQINRTGLQDGQQGTDRGRGARQSHSHHRLRAQALQSREQGLGQGGAASIQFGIRPDQIPIEDRRGRRARPAPGRQRRPADRRTPGRRQRPGCRPQQPLALVGAQQVQGTARRLRSRLQGLHDLRDCLQHQRAHTRRLGRLHRLHRQRETLAVVVHRQRQRVAGELLAHRMSPWPIDVAASLPGIAPR